MSIYCRRSGCFPHLTKTVTEKQLLCPYRLLSQPQSNIMSDQANNRCYHNFGVEVVLVVLHRKDCAAASMKCKGSSVTRSAGILLAFVKEAVLTSADTCP